MSYSISAGGQPAYAAARLKEQAAALTYLVGKEAELKEKALALALEALAANSDDVSVNVTVVGHGYDHAGKTVQGVSVSVTASS